MFSGPGRAEQHSMTIPQEASLTNAKRPKLELLDPSALERIVDEAMDEVEESGEIQDLPERAPWELHKLTKEAKKSVEDLDEAHQAELKKQLEFYAEGLLKKATDLAKSGLTQQATAIKKIVTEIGEDTSKFTSALGL